MRESGIRAYNRVLNVRLKWIRIQKVTYCHSIPAEMTLPFCILQFYWVPVQQQVTHQIKVYMARNNFYMLQSHLKRISCYIVTLAIQKAESTT